MTDDEILEMAKQVGNDPLSLDIIAFARLVAERQKEIDAGICEQQICDIANADAEYVDGRSMGCVVCASKIRSQK